MTQIIFLKNCKGYFLPIAKVYNKKKNSSNDLLIKSFKGKSILNLSMNCRKIGWNFWDST